MGVARGPDVKGTLTIASRQGSSCPLIFLNDSTQQVTLRLDIRGCLVVLWFSTLVRERSSGASVSMFIVVVK